MSSDSTSLGCFQKNLHIFIAPSTTIHEREMFKGSVLGDKRKTGQLPSRPACELPKSFMLPLKETECWT